MSYTYFISCIVKNGLFHKFINGVIKVNSRIRDMSDIELIEDSISSKMKKRKGTVLILNIVPLDTGGDNEKKE